MIVVVSQLTTLLVENLPGGPSNGKRSLGDAESLRPHCLTDVVVRDISALTVHIVHDPCGRHRDADLSKVTYNLRQELAGISFRQRYVDNFLCFEMPVPIAFPLGPVTRIAYALLLLNQPSYLWSLDTINFHHRKRSAASNYPHRISLPARPHDVSAAWSPRR